MATYQALVDISVGSVYIEAGTTFTDVGPGAAVPSTYIPPCHAVNPLDADALNKIWLTGPQLSEVEPWRAIFPWGQWGSRWSGRAGVAPTIWWYRVTGDGWALKGHEGLGLRTVGDLRL